MEGMDLAEALRHCKTVVTNRTYVQNVVQVAAPFSPNRIAILFPSNGALAYSVSMREDMTIASAMGPTIFTLNLEFNIWNNADMPQRTWFIISQGSDRVIEIYETFCDDLKWVNALGQLRGIGQGFPGFSPRPEPKHPTQLESNFPREPSRGV